MRVELRVRTFIKLCINKSQYLSDAFLKQLTGLDNCINKLFNMLEDDDIPRERRQNPKQVMGNIGRRPVTRGVHGVRSHPPPPHRIQRSAF